MLPVHDRAEVVIFHPDKTHSNVGFKVRHLGISNVRGSFGEYEATVEFDPEDMSTLSVVATIQTSSVDTGNERRDNHLRSDDFFNAEEFPTLQFVSKEVRDLEDGEFKLVGDLTIRDVTKEIALNAEFLGMASAQNGRKAGFEARTTIDRLRVQSEIRQADRNWWFGSRKRRRDHSGNGAGRTSGIIHPESAQPAPGVRRARGDILCRGRAGIVVGACFCKRFHLIK